MQLRRHQSARDGGIGLHERTRSGFIERLEDRNAERLVTRFFRASSEDQLTPILSLLGIERSDAPVLRCPPWSNSRPNRGAVRAVVHR